MIFRLSSLVIASFWHFVVLLPDLAAQGNEHFTHIVESRGGEYLKQIQALTFAIVREKSTVQFPPQNAEEELVARSAAIRVANPYLYLWLDGQFTSFIQDLTGSVIQQRVWADSNPLFEGMSLDPSGSDMFAFYARPADVGVNRNWPCLYIPAVADPITSFGSGLRNEATYIALLEALAFQPQEGIDLPWVGDAAGFHHSRAAWMTLAASYLIDYAGDSDDHLRILAAEVLRQRIVGPETATIIRAVWVETYAAIVPDVLTGATMAEGFLAAEKPLQVLTGARAAYVLIRRSESKEFRLRLRNKIHAAASRMQEPTVKACLDNLVGVIDKMFLRE